MITFLSLSLKEVNVRLQWRRLWIWKVQEISTPGENNRSCWRVRKRGEKGTVRLRKTAGSLSAETAVAVKLVGCAGQLCLWCLRLQPVGLNSILESRKGEFCVCCMVTYFFWPPVMGLTFGISLRVK